MHLVQLLQEIFDPGTIIPMLERTETQNVGDLIKVLWPTDDGTGIVSHILCLQSLRLFLKII